MKNKNEISVTINDTELPVKEYQGQRVVTLKEIDTVHKRPEGTARRNFNAIKKKERIFEGTDYFKVSADEFRTRFDPDYSRQATEDVTLIAESGYLMLAKTLTDDLAWTVQRQLVNTYFQATPEQRQKAAQQPKIQAPKRPPLSSMNSAVKLALQVMGENNVDSAFKLVMLREAFEPYGVPIPADCVTVEQRYMDLTTIAKQLGVLVASSGNPSPRAIGGIIQEIGVSEHEVKRAPYTSNGHSADSELYAESVAERVGAWLEHHHYPTVIRGRDGKHQNVQYAEVN